MSGGIVSRHGQLDVDAPTERIVLATPTHDAKPEEQLLPSWFLPGLVGLGGLAIVVALVLAVVGSTGGDGVAAVPSTAPAPTTVSQAAADQYLQRLTNLNGDMSFYGAQYGRGRTKAHADAYLAAGTQACHLGREAGYTDRATAHTLQASLTPGDLGDPPLRSYIDSDLALKMTQAAWQFLC